MTEHQQPKETLEALDELYKFVDGLDPDFIIRERISIIKSRIQDPRSRPHPAPAFSDAENKWCDEYAVAYNQGIDAGARKAREDFASALIDFIDANNVIVPDEESEESDDMLFTGEIRAKIESLRNPQQQAGDP